MESCRRRVHVRILLHDAKVLCISIVAMWQSSAPGKVLRIILGVADKSQLDYS